MPGENLFFADSDDWSLAGEWRNNGLALFNMQSEFDVEVHTLGEINLPNHPLVEGLNSFSGSLEFFINHLIKVGPLLHHGWTAHH